jgi:hypothetical protein
MALELMAAGTTHAFLLRGRVFAPPPIQPAMAAALAARQRRTAARTVAPVVFWQISGKWHSERRENLRCAWWSWGDLNP